MHLTNFIDRLKLEHAIQKSAKREGPFLVAFLLLMSFLLFDRASWSQMEIVSRIKSMYSVSDFMSITSPSEAAAMLQTMTSTVSSTYQAGALTRSLGFLVEPLVVYEVFNETDCSQYSTNLTGLPKPERVSCVTDVGGAPDLSWIHHNCSFKSQNIGVVDVACNNGSLSLGSHRLQSINFARRIKSVSLLSSFYSLSEDCIFVQAVIYGSTISGKIATSAASYMLPNSTRNFYLWWGLAGVGWLVGAGAFFIDFLSTLKKRKLKKHVGIRFLCFRLPVTLKMIQSLLLVSVACSRIVLRSRFLNQPSDLVIDHYHRYRDSGHSAASGGTGNVIGGDLSLDAFSTLQLYNFYQSLKKIGNILEYFDMGCLIGMILCFGRVMEIPNAHPRIAMLSQTFQLARTQIINFTFMVVLVMGMFAVVGKLLMSESDSYHFGSLYQTLRTQIAILIGIWPFQGSVDSFNSFLTITYLIVFGFVGFFVLLSFFIVIVVDNFKRYKLSVEENVTEQNVVIDLRDVIWRWNVSRGCEWPSRLVVITALNVIRDRKNHHIEGKSRAVNEPAKEDSQAPGADVIDNGQDQTLEPQLQRVSLTSTVSGRFAAKQTGVTNAVHYDEYIETLRWLKKLTAADLPMVEEDSEIGTQTLVNIKKLVLQGRNQSFDIESANNMWEWYSVRYGSSSSEFLHPDFALDGHRVGLKCRVLVRQLDDFRKNINRAIIAAHDQINRMKTILIAKEAEICTIDAEIAKVKREIAQARAESKSLLLALEGDNTNWEEKDMRALRILNSQVQAQTLKLRDFAKNRVTGPTL